MKKTKIWQSAYWNEVLEFKIKIKVWHIALLVIILQASYVGIGYLYSAIGVFTK
jgi:hypothetical protein